MKSLCFFTCSFTRVFDVPAQVFGCKKYLLHYVHLTDFPGYEFVNDPATVSF